MFRDYDWTEKAWFVFAFVGMAFLIALAFAGASRNMM